MASAVAAVSGQAPHASLPVGSAREVRGVVTRARGADSRPLAGVWVTLHRVGRDAAGALDSVRTDARGRFVLRFRTTGDTNALYFASSRYSGITYFTPPLRKVLVSGPEADLMVFDTTSTAIPIRVAGRHVVVMASDSTRARPIVEAYELSNDTSLTRVAGVAERPTFETALPDGAIDPRATDGDVPADAVVFTTGRVRVLAPLAPGVKQLSYRYHVPANAKPITVVLFSPVDVLEVLVEGATASVSGGGLIETEPAQLGGRSLRRFLAHDAPANSVVVISAPAAGASLNSRIALIVTGVGAAMLLALAVSFSRPDPALARRDLGR